MNPESSYKVYWGRVARTIRYEDPNGTVLFSFDVDTSNGKNLVILEPPSKRLIDAEQQRNDLALERVKEHLLSLGFQVELFPG